MSDKKRLFIGINVNFTEKTEDFYLSLRDLIPEAEIKWVKPDNIHITLKFLGSTEQDMIPEISSKLETVCKKHDPFDSILKGIGVFKDTYHPKVIWFGIKNTAKIEAVKNDIENSLGELGFEIDYRRFVPHLTVGRFKKPGPEKELRELVNSNAELSLQSFHVEDIILYESILQQGGPEYKQAGRFPLSKEEGFKEFRF